jgi:hypothetical protein
MPELRADIERHSFFGLVGVGAMSGCGFSSGYLKSRKLAPGTALLHGRVVWRRQRAAGLFCVSKKPAITRAYAG